MSTLWPTPESLQLVTPHQREKYALATAGPVGILGGNPGVGKTFVTAQIIRATAANYGLQSIAVAAPTGKAAQRVNELLIEHGIHNLSASTIHRLLGVTRAGYDKKGWGFRYGEDLALPQRFIFIDEASMLGSGLLASLLAATRPGTHLLLIGDFAQLPPVEHGAPLRDMIEAGLPYGEITEPMRNEGDIVKACREIKEGRPFHPSEAIDLKAGHNLCHLEADSNAKAVGDLLQVIRDTPKKYDPIWDIQVLVAVNEKSEVSRKSLNDVLHGTLNPNGETVKDLGFRVGDKVICTTNQMLPLISCTHCNYGDKYIVFENGEYICTECEERTLPKNMLQDVVANGEMGRVDLVDKQMMHVKFDSPERIIRVAGSSALGSWELGYAITCHKSQGSQWPVVIVLAGDSRGADMVTSFEWHRTALSRAQDLCFTIGKLAAIHRQCRKGAIRTRKTFLRELLMEGSNNDSSRT